MVLPAKKYYTPEEYLALEETAEYKSEYYNGEIFQMAGTTFDHNQIAGNIYNALTQIFLNRPCRVFIGEVRILVKKSGLYTYPDVVALCGEIETAPNSPTTITNPSVIVEVLSDSTAAYDRGAKFELYRGLESLQTYLLIEQKRVSVDRYQRTDSGEWLLKPHNNLEETLSLPIIEAEIPLSQIYQRIVFGVKGQED